MNKKKLVTAVVAATLSAACCGGVLAGCAKQPYLFEYDIAVVGGTGGGTLKDGESCTVTAEIPEGKVFDKWVNEYGEVLSTVNPYTFKVNGDLEIRAVVADAETCRVEVVGGTITGTDDYIANVYKGQSVSVTAQSSQSHKFVKWIINGVEESTANPYVFTADKDIKLEAVVDASYLVAVSGGTIGGGDDIRQIFNGGDECTIIADAPPQGSSFIYWYVIDENENEVRVAYTESYTFTVTGTDKYYAKYGKKYTLSVIGGTVDGLTEVSLMEGDNATVTLDIDSIPANKGFAGWKIGGVTVSTALTYTLRNVNENTEIVAELVDKVPFATPGNSANEMFKFNSSYTVEFDRNGDKSHTEFAENVEYIMYYFYDSPYADKDEYVGRLKMVRGSNKKDNAGNTFGAEFHTLDGTYVMGVKGGLGDLYIDYAQVGDTKKDTLFAILKAAIGDNYDADTPYYVAAQTCGGTAYSVCAPSEISAIGPAAFIEGTAPALRTVTVSGGKFKNAEQTSITVYEGQKLTVVCESDLFNGWAINGDVQNTVEQNPYTFTVDGDMTVAAVYEGMSAVTVHGGTIKDGGATSGSFEAGTSVTVVADAAESGKLFAYWYTLDGGVERKLTDSEEYTFSVTASIDLYVKYSNIYTLTIVGGTLDGEDETENNKYTIVETNGYTVKLDPSKIPSGQGFTGWKIGDSVVSSAQEYALAAGSITADTAIEAVYADLVYEFTAPKMDNNESFRPRRHDANDYVLEMARGGALFGNANVDYIKFYIYTSPYADKTDYVGAFKFDKLGEYRIATMDGQTVWFVEGNDGNFWLETKNGYGNPSTKATCRTIFERILGTEFDENTPYYLAAQACGKDYSIYAPSEISVIGPQEFIFGNVSKHTVTVEGGAIKNASLTSVSVYAGTNITVICASDAFSHWLVNNEIASTDGEYTLTVTEDLTVVAVIEGGVTVTVHDGTIKGSGETSGSYEAGDSVTVTADPADSGKVFGYWYTLDGGAEKKLAETEEYTFNVTASVALYVKYGNIYKITVVGGTVDGLTADGDGAYTIVDLKEYTVKYGGAAAPEGKYFAGWKIGDDLVSESSDYVIAANTVNSDLTIEAAYADQIHEFATPGNDNNAMFRYTATDTMEFDRSGKTAFAANVEYVMYYFYDNPYADKNDYVGRLKMVRGSTRNDNAGNKFTAEFVTLDGTYVAGIKGGFGNLYLDYNVIGSSKRETMFAIFKAAIGESYDANTPYYIAAQSCGADGGKYAPSEISVIGSLAFIEGTAPAQYSVSVKGGEIKNTSLTTVNMYSGQTVTVICSADAFKHWLVNGEIASTDGTYTFAVSGDATVVAVRDGEVTVTVAGGTVNGATSVTVESGAAVTLIADAAEQGKTFGYWYTLDGGVKTKLSEQAEYSFNVSSDIEILAEFVNVHTLTVIGGTLDGADKSANGEYTIREDKSYTIRLDLNDIPSGKGFTGWKLGETAVSTAYEYSFAAGGITADTVIEAAYADQVHEFAKPVNDNNQMFSYTSSGTMEIDRKNKGVQSEFDNANIEYMTFYFYTTPFAENTAENAAGSIKLVRDVSSGSEKFYFAKLDGTKIWDVKGRKSDLYQDETCGQASKKDAMFLLVKAGVASYDPNTPYYIAVQSFGKAGSIYAPSEISEIGPQALIYNNVAQYTVTVDGGVVQGTALTTVTLYEGQSITIVPTKDMFEHWLVNDEQVTDNPYTFTVSADVTLKAIYGGESSVTVTGGTVFGSADTFVTVSNGSEITVAANAAAENTEFAYWYKLDGDDEIVLSRNETYTFTVLENTAVYAKFANLYKVTVTGGKIDGLTKNADGTYTVKDLDEYVLRLTLSAIPDGKSFAHWTDGEDIVASNYVHKLAAGYFAGDTEIIAEYADTTALDVTLSMASGTEMIRRSDAYVIDIDRCFPSPKNTAFQENVDHVKLYIYASADADKDDYVGILIVDRKCEKNNDNGQPLRFATEDGVTITRLEGVPNNIWLSTLDGYSGDRRGNFRKFLQQCIGESYSAEQEYYFAAQACGDHETYGDGGISDIGTQAF